MRDIIIVGAGPVGLTAALRLARAGVAVTILEADAQPNEEWRASTFHAPTLEMCEEMGVVDQMLAAGVVAAKYQVRDWSTGRVAEFDFGALADETKYPFRLQLEQYKYSAILRDRLSRLPGVTLRYGAQVAAIEQADDSVTALLDGGDALSARWLIGADGANSFVRRSTGVGFEGLTYQTRALLLSVDAPLDEWFPDICYVNYVADSRESPGMILRIPDLWRVSFQLPDNLSDEEARSDAYVSARLKAVFGDRHIPLSPSRQIFRVHQRVADRFRIGQLLLIGDAAHINSPLGGMGLNSGIHDAYHLGSVLPAVIAGEADGAMVDDWAEARRDAALKDVQRITHRNVSDLGERDQDRLNATLDRYIGIAADPQLARAWMREAAMLTSVRAQGIGPRKAA